MATTPDPAAEQATLPLRPVAGGQVPPDKVVGRERLIRRLWQRLERQGVLLLAERRIGKTSVLRKMEAEPIDGWVARYVVVESVRNPATFVERIAEATRDLLDSPAEWRQRMGGVLQKLGGAKLGDWEVPEIRALWRSLLLDLLAQLAKHDKRIVVMLDEFPAAVANIRKDVGAESAMELLDTLRSWQLSSAAGRVVLLYTGSIGLHVVLNEFRDAGYQGAPTNMMAKLSLGSLEGDAAVELAQRGLLALVRDGDLRIDPAGVSALAEEIARLTDGLPFYVDQLIEQLAEVSEDGRVPDVEQTLLGLLDHPDDPAFFRHYADRIDLYYGRARVPLANALLSAISRVPGGVAEEDLSAEVRTSGLAKTLPECQEVLALLLEDHYIVKGAGDERVYRFRYEVIRRWWRRNRA